MGLAAATRPVPPVYRICPEALGVAFREVTKNRRKNILRQTAPDFLNLLSDPTMFSSREMGRLFGVHFLNAMAKEAEEENKIAKVGRTSAHHRSTSKHRNGLSL